MDTRVKRRVWYAAAAVLVAGGAGAAFAVGGATDWICHDSGGHWTRTAVTSLASDIFYLTWIPGTRSLWAAGDQANTDYGVILKYGP